MNTIYKICGVGVVAAVLASGAYADEMAIRLGLGGLYGNYKSSVSGSDYTNKGGYLTILGRGITNDSRFLTEGGGDIALGSYTAGGQSGSMGHSDILFNIGYNLLSEAHPLYLKLEYNYTNFSEKLTQNRFSTSLHQIGVGVLGFIPTAGKLRYEYSAGYYYIPAAAHYMGDTSSALDGYSYALKAHMGLSYQASEKLGYFMNLKAKYYDLARSKLGENLSYPASQNLVGMLEVGVQFGL